MSITAHDIENEAQHLLADKTWKGHLILGSIILIIAGVISSPVFTLIRSLLEVVLAVGGISLLCYAGYQYYQIQKTKDGE